MNAVLTTPDARPASLGCDVAHRGEQHGVEGHAGAEPEQDHAREHVDDEGAVDRRAGEEQEPDRGEAEADAERLPNAVAHHELRRQAERQDGHDDVAGQEGEADLERAVAEDELEVERGEEEPREHRGGPEHADDVRDREVAMPEEPERHERRLHARLDEEEHAQERAGDGEQPERLRRDVQPTSFPFTIAYTASISDAVTVTAPATSSRTPAVATRCRPGARAARTRRPRSRSGTFTRKIQCQSSSVREDSAEEHADRAAARGDEAEDAHRLRALGRAR